MKTLLQIVQDCNRELALVVPSAVATSNDQQTLQQLALLNRDGKELSAMCGPNQGWPVLRAEHSISVVAATDNYALPSDFQYYINATGWDRTRKWRLAGPVTPVEWQFLKSGYPAAGFDYRFRIMNNRVYLDPVPTSTGTLVIEYYSKNWVQAADTSTKEYFTLDTDVPLLDDFLLAMGLRWRFLNAKGFDYAQQKLECENAIERTMGRAGMGRTLTLTGPVIGQPHYLDGLNIPDSGVGI